MIGINDLTVIHRDLLREEIWYNHGVQGLLCKKMWIQTMDNIYICIMDIHHNPGLNEVRIDWKLDRDFCWDLLRISMGNHGQIWQIHEGFCQRRHEHVNWYLRWVDKGSTNPGFILDQSQSFRTNVPYASCCWNI